MYTAEGTIEIDIDEFTEFVANKLPCKGESIYQLGIPRFNYDNWVIEVDFAISSDTEPSSWSVTPKAVKQWEEMALKRQSVGEGDRIHPSPDF